MLKNGNPAARVSADRVLEIAATGKRLDIKNLTEIPDEVQSELLAVRAVMRRFRVSFWHAKTICQLSGLGGLAA